MNYYQNLWLKTRRRFTQYFTGAIENPRWLLMFVVTRIQVLRSLGIFISKRPQSKSNRENENSIFKNLDPNKIVRGLQIDGLYININLPENILNFNFCLLNKLFR